MIQAQKTALSKREDNAVFPGVQLSLIYTLPASAYEHSGRVLVWRTERETDQGEPYAHTPKHTPESSRGHGTLLHWTFPSSRKPLCCSSITTTHCLRNPHKHLEIYKLPLHTENKHFHTDSLLFTTQSKPKHSPHHHLLHLYHSVLPSSPKQEVIFWA